MQVLNYKTKKEIEVKDHNQKSLSFLYETAIGRGILKILVYPWITKLYGKYNDSKLSTRKIKSFIKNNHIPMEEYEKQEYKSFNDFFTRKINLEYRNISRKEEDFISCCDNKLRVYPVNKDLIFKVKGSNYSVESILQDNLLAKKYEDGLCLVFRLCVDDYHRYIFFDDGEILKTSKIPGKFHTVNPIAYENFQVFRENNRELTVLETKNFGTVTQVEVGALMVGKIVNHPVKKFTRGEEKGYFKFGGSTIILFLEKDKLEIDPLILEYSSRGIETKLQMGEVIGKKTKTKGR